MKYLIITADDYGMSEAVNRGIEEGLEAGFLTSTNLMTNMPFRERAGTFREHFPAVSLGLHWNLTCGRPLTPAEKVPTLVEPDGSFHSYQRFRSLYRAGKISADNIRTELSAQGREFVRITGSAPDYWNTHQNVHVDFGIYFLFARIAADGAQNGVGKPVLAMRSYQRIYVGPKGTDSLQPLKWRLAEPLKARLLDRWQGKLRRQGFAAPDGRLVYRNESDQNDIRHVLAHIRWKKDGAVAEMVFHPAKAVDSPFFGKMCDNRLEEYRTVTSRENLEALRASGIRAVSFSLFLNGSSEDSRT